MDAEKGSENAHKRSKATYSVPRVFVGIVLLVFVVSICNFSLSVILWLRVVDLSGQNVSHKDEYIGKTEETSAIGHNLELTEDMLMVNDNFTKWLNNQHKIGRYTLPVPVQDMLHINHERYRRSSTGMCDLCSQCSHVRKGSRCHRCCWKEMTDEVHKLKNEIQSLKQQISPTGSSTRTTHQYEDRLGQFQGGAAKDCTSNAYTNAAQTYLHTTTDGKICMWQYAKWMTNGARQLYKLNTIDGRVEVTLDGIFFIYGQLIINGMGPRVSQGVWVMSGGQRKEIARCVETAIPSGTSPAYRTCSFGVMTKLDKGSSVYLALTTILPKAIRLLHTNKTAYFGLIKFTGANT